MSKVGSKDNNAVATSRFPAQWHLPFRNTITKTDRQNIASLLGDAEKERKACASEVNKLKAALMTLENRLDDAEKKEEYLRSLLSPIHRMPPEVMMEIFKVCCNSPEANSIPYSSPELPVTLKLSMVCGLWRNIVVSTPSLWSNLSVNGHASDARSFKVTKLFMDRSQSTPLALNIIYSDNTNRTRIGPDIMGVLTTHSNRWRSVDFDIDALRSRSPSFPAIRGHLAVLTNLIVDCPMPGVRGYNRGFLRAFEDAPCLRSVALCGGPAMADLVLPWHQLEVVQLGQCEIGRTLHILKNCTSVAQLTIDSIALPIPEAATDNLIHLSLPTVRTLSLVLNEFSMFLFKHLTLPGLENLSVRNDDFVEWNAPWDVEHILSALSLCNLTSLTLTKVPLRDGDFISLLEVMPTLESLSFSEYIPVFKPRKDPNNMTITPYVLARLSLANSDFPLMMPRPDSARLLPHLQHLSLCVYAGGLDQRALGKAVLSRRTGSDSSNDQNIGEVAHQGLRSFEVVVLLPDAKATASLELVSWLECLSDVGLRVRVKTETTKYGLGFALESMVVMSDISDSDEDSGDDSDNE